MAPEWMRNALCTNTWDGRTWDDLKKSEQVETCWSCPVRRECLEQVFRDRVSGVVQGGYSWPEMLDEASKMRRSVRDAQEQGLPGIAP